MVYHCYLELEDEPLLLYWMPARPSPEERERRKVLLDRAKKGRPRDLRMLARDYRVILPLIMPKLPIALQKTMLDLAHRPRENGGTFHNGNGRAK